MVNHFNEPVTYSSDRFLERNPDALNLDFMGLLGGASTSASTSAPTSAAGVGPGMTDALEGAGSINPFVRALFSGKAIVTQAHPKSEDTIVAAQQPVKLMHAPSTWRKGTIRRMPVGHGATTATIAEEDRDNASPAGLERELGHIERDRDEGHMMMLWLFSIFFLRSPSVIIHLLMCLTYLMYLVCLVSLMLNCLMLLGRLV